MHDRFLIRGAFVNLLGIVAKLIHPLFFVFIIRMFGTDMVGVYFLATFITQVASSAVTAGYGDGIVLFAASNHAKSQQDELYRVLGNGFAITLGVSILVAAAGQIGSDWLVATFYADRPELAGALRLLLWSVPLVAIPNVAIAATKAQMRMEYDALINGLCKPFSLLIFATLAYLFELGLLGLAGAHLLSQALLSVLSLLAFARHYSIRRTFAAMTHLSMERDLLAFAIPQSLNMTFIRYITRLDVIMLAAYGYSNHAVALYSSAALVTGSLREVKMAFGSALAPIAARLHATHAREELEAVFGRISRWTTTLVAPLVLCLVVLRDDILLLIDPSFVADTTFMAMLLIPPFLSCAFGMTGNLIAYTRHSNWSLFNSLLVAFLNTGFNAFLIPRLGLFGAALATSAAATATTVAQLIELRWLEALRLRPRYVWKPHVGLLGMMLVVLLCWDPVALPSLAMRVGLAFVLAVGFVVAMLALRHEEVVAGAARLRSRLGNAVG